MLGWKKFGKMETRYAGRVNHDFIYRDEYFRNVDCYVGGHTSRGDEMCSSTCSPPGMQYVLVVYGRTCHSRIYVRVIYYRRISSLEMGAFYWMLILRWCAVRISHPGGSMPVTVMIWLWVDSDGIRRPCYPLCTLWFLVNI